MNAKTTIIVMVMLSCFYYGCASNSGLKEELSSSGPVISIDVNDETKMAYLGDIKHTLNLYSQLLADLKYYHKPNSTRELSQEIDEYVETYVNDFLFNSDSNGSVDVQMEVAKIHLLVVSLYLDMGDTIKAQGYLKSFSERYHKDTYLLAKTLNSKDIGYQSLEQGMDELTERARRERAPAVNEK
jgi:hypothetical protein